MFKTNLRLFSLNFSRLAFEVGEAKPSQAKYFINSFTASFFFNYPINTVI